MDEVPESWRSCSGGLEANGTIYVNSTLKNESKDKLWLLVIGLVLGFNCPIAW